ncbi:MAG: GNAT family N-acetyltransferase [Pirellula sp.]
MSQPTESPRSQQPGDAILISCDPTRLDVLAIHQTLSNCYWSPGLPLAVLQKAIAGSLCFGAYHGSQQVGFARVVTDRATFAYLCDVYVLEAYRGQGIGRQLMEHVVAHPDLQGLRRFVLVTRDAHGLYARFGFTPLAKPQGFMEILRPDVYQQTPQP